MNPYGTPLWFKALWLLAMAAGVLIAIVVPGSFFLIAYLLRRERTVTSTERPLNRQLAGSVIPTFASRRDRWAPSEGGVRYGAQVPRGGRSVVVTLRGRR